MVTQCLPMPEGLTVGGFVLVVTESQTGTDYIREELTSGEHVSLTCTF